MEKKDILANLKENHNLFLLLTEDIKTYVVDINKRNIKESYFKSTKYGINIAEDKKKMPILLYYDMESGYFQSYFTDGSFGSFILLDDKGKNVALYESFRENGFPLNHEWFNKKVIDLTMEEKSSIYSVPLCFNNSDLIPAQNIKYYLYSYSRENLKCVSEIMEKINNYFEGRTIYLRDFIEKIWLDARKNLENSITDFETEIDRENKYYEFLEEANAKIKTKVRTNK